MEGDTYILGQKGQLSQRALTVRKSGNRIRNGHPYCKRKPSNGVSLCLDGTHPNTRLLFQSDPLSPGNCGM
jgi:hypothetical protein